MISKSLITLLLLFSATFANASEYKLEQVLPNLVKPWGISFIDNQNVLVTQKTGEILKINLNTKEVIELEHNLKVVSPHWQAGMLDILYDNGNVFVSYTEDRGNDQTSTSIAKGSLNGNTLENFENIFQSEPPLWDNIHWGSRLMIKDQLLYASIGERAQGSKAQDPTNHIGKIIRINQDGSSPSDNPFSTKSDWLPEVYQIGLRNPQGMALNHTDNQIYITNHGPKGGDFFGEVIADTNYGWMDVAWGGTDYDGSIIGDGSAWKEGLLKPIYRWIPSIAVSDMTFYKGDQFPELKDNIILTSLKAGRLISLEFSNGKASNETILVQGMGRLRDVEQNDEGDLFVIIDDDVSGIYKLTRN